MRVLISGLNYLINEVFHSARPFMQPQRVVDRTKVQHPTRHPKVDSNLLTIVEILNVKKSLAEPFNVCVHTSAFYEWMIV